MIVFGWIVELEQAGDLRSVIRRFTFILEVFTSLWKFWCCWVMFVDYFLDFNAYYIDNYIRWIVVLEQAGDLHGVIRSLQLILEVFIKFENLDGYGWVMFVDYFLEFNTCKHSIFVIMIIVLRWIVELEQAGGLHGAIRWFIFILEVFNIFWKFGWIFLSYICWLLFGLQYL